MSFRRALRAMLCCKVLNVSKRIFFSVPFPPSVPRRMWWARATLMESFWPCVWPRGMRANTPALFHFMIYQLSHLGFQEQFCTQMSKVPRLTTPLESQLLQVHFFATSDPPRDRMHSMWPGSCMKGAA